MMQLSRAARGSPDAEYGPQTLVRFLQWQLAAAIRRRRNH